MKKVIILILTLALVLICSTALADTQSGLFTYKLKGNGTAVITGYDWNENRGQDVYVPRLIDGYIVSEIGTFAFSDKSLDELNSLPTLGQLFGRSVTVIIPDTVTVIGEKAFFCTNVTSVQIPASVKLIGAGAFAGCHNLHSHFVDKENETYTTINGVLYNKKTKELVSFPSLYPSNKVEIPKGIVSIGEYAFYGISLWHGIEFPDSLYSIGKSAFAYATIGGTIEIEGAEKQLISFNKVAEIGDYAFANVELDGLFDFANSQIETIGDYAFEHVFITDHAWRDIYHNKIAYQGILDIIFPSSLTKLGAGSFRYFLGDKEANIGPIIRNLDFSNTKITMIPDDAFMKFGFNSSGTHEVIFPNSLQYIGKKVFRGIWNDEGIRIMIPSSVEVIDNQAFYYTRLTLSFEDEPSALTTIGDEAFSHCDISSENETIVLPNGLNKIGDRAFGNLYNGSHSINKILIPSSVTSLGDSFCNRDRIALMVEPDSYAALYASENGYSTMDAGGEDTSWLDE